MKEAKLKELETGTKTITPQKPVVTQTSFKSVSSAGKGHSDLSKSVSGADALLSKATTKSSNSSSNSHHAASNVAGNSNVPLSSSSTRKEAIAPIAPIPGLDSSAGKGTKDVDSNLDSNSRRGQYSKGGQNVEVGTDARGGNPPPLAPPPVADTQNQLTKMVSMLQQGLSVDMVAKSMNMKLDDQTMQLMDNLSKQLMLAATMAKHATKEKAEDVKPEVKMPDSLPGHAQSGGDVGMYGSSVGMGSNYPDYLQSGDSQGLEGYGYPIDSVQDSYHAAEYSAPPPDQPAVVHGGDQDGSGSNAGVKAALAQLLSKQGIRVTMGGNELANRAADPYTSQPDSYYHSDSSEQSYGGRNFPISSTTSGVPSQYLQDQGHADPYRAHGSNVRSPDTSSFSSTTPGALQKQYSGYGSDDSRSSNDGYKQGGYSLMGQSSIPGGPIASATFGTMKGQASTGVTQSSGPQPLMSLGIPGYGDGRVQGGTPRSILKNKPTPSLLGQGPLPGNTGGPSPGGHRMNPGGPRGTYPGRGNW